MTEEEKLTEDRKHFNFINIMFSLHIFMNFLLLALFYTYYYKKLLKNWVGDKYHRLNLESEETQILNQEE